MLTVGSVEIADVICFEVAFDDVVRDSVRGGGGVIVVQTNNATYGRTGQPEQQLAISQLRAVEHGRPVMIAATSGISAFIDANGDIVEQTAQFTPAVVTADVTPRTGTTLADRVGSGPEWVMTALALAAWAFAFLVALRARRRADGAGPGAGGDRSGEPARPAADGDVAVAAGSATVTGEPVPAARMAAGPPGAATGPTDETPQVSPHRSHQ